MILKAHWVLPVGLAAILVLAGLAARADETTPSAEQLEKDAQAFNSRLRADFALPKMFDFARFKSAFQRHYDSALEEMVRAKLFMARAYRAFISAVKYKYRTAKYYLGVNSRADWTHEELEAALNHKLVQDDGPRARLLQPGEELDEEEGEEEEEEHVEPLVEPEDLEAELERIREHKDEPGYRELEAELSNMEPEARSRRKRAADGEAKRTRKGPRNEFQLSEAYDRQRATDKAAPEARVPSNNPHYQQPDVPSQMGLGELKKLPGYREVYLRNITFGHRLRNYSNLPVKARYSNKNKPMLMSLTNSLVKNVAKMWWRDRNQFPGVGVPAPDRLARGGKSSYESEPAADNYVEADGHEDKPDVVWVDHRQGGCMQPVQDQGHCGSCYAFATLAYYEWAYCNETGSPVKFSEQYVIDCGTKLDRLMGCAGGVITYMALFVQNFGLELRRNYPYRAKEEQCPYDPDTPLTHMGYMRADATNIVQIPLAVIEDYLAHFPVLININTKGDFHFYGGGVYDGFWCQKKGTHSVLLIGHGREDGEEYWLIRNSHSADYGEQGHLRLNKNSNCIFPRYAFAFGNLIGDRMKVYGRRNAHVPQPVQKSGNAPAAANANVRHRMDTNEAFREEMEMARRREAARRARMARN